MAFHSIAQETIAVDECIIQKIATGFEFTEGPCWHPDGYLIFSDIPANKIFKLSSGKVEVFLDNSGMVFSDTSLLSDHIGSNGIAMDLDGNIIICQHGNHAIASLDRYGHISILANEYEGKPFNSPNDLIVRSDGTIFFTDPPYGLKEQVLNSSAFQPHAGVYLLNEGVVKLLSTRLRYPNGVCLSMEEKRLFVSSNHPDEPELWQFRISRDGHILDQEIFVHRNADGILCDIHDNLYLATHEGVVILSSAGEHIATITLDEIPSNLCWGGRDRTVLYVTARTSVYSIENLWKPNKL
jgi:gluconolactonase